MGKNRQKYDKKRNLNELLAIVIFLSSFAVFFSCENNAKIDREALVKRHSPTLNASDLLNPFTVGNGEFAFSTDFTGLQSFPEFYEETIPLVTQAQWGWHSFSNLNQYSLDQIYEEYEVNGRKVAYASHQDSEAGEYLRSNPHRLHLGQIGFKFKNQDGLPIRINEIRNIRQTENIWEGIIYSSFEVLNNMVEVETACHPVYDQIAVKIKSVLLNQGKVAISFNFPYASSKWGKNPADWHSPEKHFSTIVLESPNSVLIKRTLDTTEYCVKIYWRGDAEFTKTDRHSFNLAIKSGKNFEFTCLFLERENDQESASVTRTFSAARSFWQNFWETGGAIDLSASKDSRAKELERRIILSRYLTRIQCAGSLPPQETGLTCNSWYGKFHLEMHWWHAVHFVLWQKPELFEKSLPFYQRILPMAIHTAERQGYAGARWPKMVGPDGEESPSSIGVFLIWQQPHPIYYAELLYRYQQDPVILEKYKDIVFSSAEFMASFVQWDAKNARYILGAPLIPAQEIYPPEVTLNPGFELSYWRFGLETAQKWRERLGLERAKKWDTILELLAPLPQNNGFYQNAENTMNTFENSSYRKDHPTLLASYGMLADKTVDQKVMEKTLEKVMQSWDWETTWGWDFPLIAMTAARVGRADLAIEALLMDVPKNTYLVNGHNYQNESLPVYLPGNGSLLTAVAMMAAGWDGAPDIYAPGFPQDGQWSIKYENLVPLP